MSTVRVDCVSKTYVVGDSMLQALKTVALEVQEGEFLAITGASGSGKSTLLNIIAGIERPDSGRVVIHETEMTLLSPDQAAAFRAEHVGYIFQTFNLFPVLTARENVEVPLRLRNSDDRLCRLKAIEALRAVGMEPFATHKPRELSGGQRQRVAVARALAASPSIILADEPTANLDSRTGEEILSLMRELNREMGITFVFSTHDARIQAMASRVLELKDGSVLPPPAVARADASGRDERPCIYSLPLGTSFGTAYVH